VERTNQDKPVVMFAVDRI